MSSDDREFEQQRDIGKAFRELADIRGDVKALSVALVGYDGKNGLRGEFREFASDMERRMTKQDEALEELARWRSDASNAMDTYLKHGRRATCYGVAALEEYKKAEEEAAATRAAQWETQQTELKKARIAMLGAVLVALITALIPVIPKLVELAQNRGGG